MTVPTTLPEWAPYVFGAVPPVLVLLGILVNNVFGAWNRRRGAVESKGPSVGEAWKAADAARDRSDVSDAKAQAFTDAYYALRDVARAIVRRVRRGDQLDLTDGEDELIFRTDPNTPGGTT